MGGVNVQRTFGPDKIISFGNLLFDGPLRLDALFDLVGGPTARLEALALSGSGTSNADGSVEICFGMSFVKERNNHRRNVLGFATPDLDLCAPDVADAGMENGFKLLPRGRIRKDAAGEFFAAEPTIRANNVRAESFLDLTEGGLAGFDDFAGENVCIYDRNAASTEEVGASGFAHSNTAGNTEQSHKAEG